MWFLRLGPILRLVGLSIPDSTCGKVRAKALRQLMLYAMRPARTTSIQADEACLSVSCCPLRIEAALLLLLLERSQERNNKHYMK
jgi:hypothetical protein